MFVLLTLLIPICFCFLSSHLFIWQAHNALFIICCLLKVFISRMSEEELQLHFTYEEKTPGSYGMYMALLIKQIFHKKVTSSDLVVRIQNFV